MADPKKDDKQDEKQAAGTAAKRKRLFAVGGAVGGLALAFCAALLAVPRKPGPAPVLAGPFVGAVTPSKVQVNLSDGRGYFVLELNLKYEAYSPDYLATRTSDPVCQAEILDALVTIASSKSRADVTDKVNKPVFLEEIRHAIEPLVFPIHVGDSPSPSQADPTSRLAPGVSMSNSAFRGLYEEHVLHVDAVRKTLALDGGSELTFRGDERDLELPCGDGTSLWLDVSALDPAFVGDVKVGVKGRTRRVLWKENLVQ